MKVKTLGIGNKGIDVIDYLLISGFDRAELAVAATTSRKLSLTDLNIKIEFPSAITVDNIRKQTFPDKKIQNYLSGDTDILFLIGELDDQLMSGMLNRIAEMSNKLGILTVAMLSFPTNTSRNAVRQRATADLELIKHNADAYILVNDKDAPTEKTTSPDYVAPKFTRLCHSFISAVTDIISKPGYINVDFKDVRTILKQSGFCIYTEGKAMGERRAKIAIQQAVQAFSNMRVNLSHSRYILMSIGSAMPEISTDEISIITSFLQGEAGVSADLIWGNFEDPSLGEQIKISLITTGFDMVEESLLYDQMDIILAEPSTPNTIPLYFLADEYTPEEIAEVISFMSDIYREEGGDALVISGNTVMDYSEVLTPVLR